MVQGSDLTVRFRKCATDPAPIQSATPPPATAPDLTSLTTSVGPLVVVYVQARAVAAHRAALSGSVQLNGRGRRSGRSPRSSGSGQPRLAQGTPATAYQDHLPDDERVDQHGSVLVPEPASVGLLLEGDVVVVERELRRVLQLARSTPGIRREGNLGHG